MNDEEIDIIEYDTENAEIIDTQDNSEEIGTISENVAIGTNNYNNLKNKPQINNIELKDNKTGEQLGLQSKMDTISNLDIEDILNNFKGGI